MLQIVRAEKVDKKWGSTKLSAENCKKCTFLDNLRTITQEENIETRQMTLFFSSIFYTLTTVTFIFAIDNSQNSFSYGSAFCPFWSVKFLSFGQKLLIWTSHHTFLESRHPEATKNPNFVYFPYFLYNSYFPYKSMFYPPGG